MEIKLHNRLPVPVAEITSDDIVMQDVDDALDIMADAGYLGAESIIIHDYNLPDEFFDLRTGIAGEILQKFSTYRMKLAIVGNFDRYPGKSLKDFIRESNRQGLVYFLPTTGDAINRFSGDGSPD